MKINAFHTIAKKKRIFLLLLLVVVGFAFSTQGASAGNCSLITGSLDGCVNSLLMLVLEGLAVVLSYIADITNWAMQPSPITTSYFVQEGWKATRDFANMFFILILLGIALSFILYDSFGIKRALPNLLIIALLINFSIPIAGVLLDFANVVTSFFLKQISDGGFTQNVAQSVGLQRVFNADNFMYASADLNADKIGGNSFINILFAMGMVIGMMFIFLALALMFLIRTGYISVLLILLPIALVLSAFPPTSNHFSKWMSKFTQWVMFAPAAAFFLYLSMLVLTETNASGTSRILEMGGGTAPDSFAFTFLRYIMAWGLMLMSLTVAQSMGITGASTAMAMWSKGTKWARGKAYGAAKTGATRTAAAAGRKMDADKKLEGLAKGLQSIPLLGGILASGTRGVAAKTKTAMEKQQAPTAAEKTKWENLSDAALAAEQEVYEKSKLPGSSAKTAYIASMRAQRGKLITRDPSTGEIDHTATDALVRQSYAAAKANNNKAAMKAILQTRPTVANDIIRSEWKDDMRNHKVETSIDPVTGKAIWKNRITGKTMQEALNNVFDIDKPAFDGLKGQWTQDNVDAFLDSGHLTRSHLRWAIDLGDSPFVTLVGNSLEKASSTSNNPLVRSFVNDGLVRDFGLRSRQTPPSPPTTS